MSRTDSAPDSSMEEILASIRRIISEDAAPPKAPPAPPQRTANTLPPAPPPFVSPAPVRQPAPAPVFRSPQPAAALVQDDDDILDLGADYTAVTRRPIPNALSSAPTAAAMARPAPPPAAPAVAAAEPAPQVWPSVPSDPVLELDGDEATEPLVEPESEAIAAAPIAEPELVPEPEPVEPSPVLTEFAPAPPPVLEPAFSAAAEADPASAETAVAPEVATPAEFVPEATPAPAPAPMAAAVPVAALALAAGGRTLEDTVAELLKPMLRDWLDANMPRIIEKVMSKDAAAP